MNEKNGFTESLEVLKESPTAENLDDTIKKYVDLSVVEQVTLNEQVESIQSIFGMSKQQWISAVSEAKQEKKQLEDELNDTETVVKPKSEFFNDGEFLPRRMIDKLHRDGRRFIKLPTEKELRYYQDGVYLLNRNRAVHRMIHDELGEDLKHKYVLETINLIQSEVTENLPSDGTQPFVNPYQINLRNGIYDIKEMRFRPHDDAFRSTVQIPVDYDQTAKCPEIDEWFLDVLDRDKENIALAIEFIAVSMLQTILIPKMLIVFGPTHTGKSTFLQLIQAFLGARNTSSVSLQAIADKNNRFDRSNLQGKLANFDFDSSGRSLTDDGYVKKITAGDTINVESKGIQSWNMIPYTTLFAATNKLPPSNDKTTGFYNRIVILPFGRQHENAPDREYLARLTKPSELSGLLNIALEKLPRLCKDGHFQQTNTTKQALVDYVLGNEPILQFYSQFYQKVDDKDMMVKLDEMFDYFIAWLHSEKIKTTPTKREFTETISKQLGVKGTTKIPKHSEDSGNFEKGWRNIRERHDADFELLNTIKDNKQTRLNF